MMDFYKTNVFDEESETLIITHKNVFDLIKSIWYLSKTNSYMRTSLIEDYLISMNSFKMPSHIGDSIGFHFKNNLKQRLNHSYIIKKVRNEI